MATRSPETIFALATPPGRAGVAIIRISGPQSDAALSALCDAGLPDFRRASLRRLRDSVSRETIDDALVLRFDSGESFTGEATVEVQCHGGPAVVAALLSSLSALPGLRLARPGEFTRRAFANNRLDLAQVEGLADLISAETAAQHRAALRAYDGGLGALCRDWSHGLTRGLALIEATIDFADEEIPDETWTVAYGEIARVHSGVDTELQGAQLVERLRNGWRVAIIGAPNAGKSSLVNALSRRDVAITSPQAGTTRDSIEVALDLGGYPVTLIDTAGIRETGDEIERAGVARARSVADASDLRLALVAADAPLDPVADALMLPEDLRVWNKTDLTAAPDQYTLAISTRTGAGLDDLLAALQERLSDGLPAEAGLMLRQRHLEALTETRDALARFVALAGDTVSRLGDAPEIAAEEVRTARMALGRITGEGGVESLLDVIFSEFCLGK